MKVEEKSKILISSSDYKIGKDKYAYNKSILKGKCIIYKKSIQKKRRRFVNKEINIFIDFYSKKKGTIEEEFSELAKKWKNETSHFSTTLHIVNNANYFKIIGMGIKVLPYILNDLQSSPNHWHTALNAITKINPVLNPSDLRSINKIREAWLFWGRENNYIK